MRGMTGMFNGINVEASLAIIIMPCKDRLGKCLTIVKIGTAMSVYVSSAANAADR